MKNLKQLELLKVFLFRISTVRYQGYAPFGFDMPDVFYEDERAKAPVGKFPRIDFG